jgi:dihydrofolate reductase
MLAIAAMSRNRVIGAQGRIPWRIPEEHRWFRRTTMGGVLVMGRKTFESLPRPLDGRVNVVLTHDPRRFLDDERRRGRLAQGVLREAPAPEDVRLDFPDLPGTEVHLVRSLATLGDDPGRPVWLCGGAQLYEQFLPACTELYLTVVDREVEGDASFPRFEHLFTEVGVVHQGEGFHVLHHRRAA